MVIIQKIALCLIIIGAINWGLVGSFNFNLVEWLFQAGSVITRIIYITIAVCGLFSITMLFWRHHDID